MNLGEMFGMLDNSPSYQQQSQQSVDTYGYDPFTQPPEPQYQDQPSMSWEEAFSNFKTTPVLYNMDGFISPYSSNNWGSNSKLLQYIDDQSRLPALENKIDPNKIFTAEINSLRALEADQSKLIKMMEKKLYESISEKGKVGLTEEEIEALSAITSGRNAIASMANARVTIKKNIADIRIKQNQNANVPAGNTAGNGGYGGSTMDIGRSMLDKIFEVPAGTSNLPTTNIDYSPISASDAGRVLDDLVPNVGSNIRFEGQEPKTYVVVGENDTDITFETYDSEGRLIPDYPAPDVDTSSITIDRDGHKAVDGYLVEYPLKEK